MNGEDYGGILKNKHITNMLILELTYSNENKINIFCNGFIYNIFGKKLYLYF